MRLLACIVLAASLTGCAGNSAPPLRSAYADLTAFWQEAANSLKIAPDEGRLARWTLGYDSAGNILHTSFTIYVDRGTGEYEVYTFNEDAGQKARWERLVMKGAAPAATVPASRAFGAINQLGFHELERHQQLAPPVLFWFFAETGERNYQPIAGGYVLQDGRLTPFGPDGVTVRGEQGRFGIAADAITTGSTPQSTTTASRQNPGPPMFVVPLSPQD